MDSRGHVMEEGVKAQTKLEAFRQHWEQMRHAEGQRLSFTNFYALIVAGVLAFISQSGGSGKYIVLFGVLAGISLIGMVLCIRTNKAIERHRDLAWDLAKELTEDTREKLYTAFWEEKGCWRKFTTLRVLFPVLYGGLLVLFALIACRVIRLG